ncbi:AIM24 family protein [Pseudosulfitobacter pseudonitzschiae]|uniref:AIM24 family protein n=1 Tax=Pseudosulfitobacter pseudonitzschiae TaxID=1402135 RepID=UPI003B807014
MKFDVIDKQSTPFGLAEVLQVKQLAGSSDARSAEQLFFVSQAGMRMKMVKLTLPNANSRVRVEPGALYYMSGDLEIKASTGGGILRGLARRVTSGESLFVNEIHGKGEIYLEPTFGHFILINIEDDAIIVDKSLFYAGLGNLDISASMNRAAAGLVGGEGFFQTKISGTGVAVLFSPVPMNEIQQIEIRNNKLSVDGNFALLRTGGVDFSVEKSSKSWVATSVSGEGLLQTFKGNGQVWIAPTQGVYNKLATPNGLMELAGPPGARSTNT